MKQRQAGLTLIEITLALGIIAVLLGGVLKGQDLLFNRKVQASFDLTREISAAFNAYMDRYGQMPGDDNAAARRFPAAQPVPINGQARGVLRFGDCAANAGGTFVMTTDNCEALYHLRLAGLINGTGVEPLHTPFGGLAFPAAGNDVVAGLGSSLVLAFAPGSLTQRAARAIDEAFDDGDPSTGLFRCSASKGYNDATADAPTNVYCAMSL